MKLYRTKQGFVATQAEANAIGGEFEKVEVPTTEGRETLAQFLNNLTSTVQVLDVREEQPPTKLSGDLYSSPMSARTTIAQIDAGMCASAIRQMEGRPLGRILTAALERLEILSHKLPSKTESEPSHFEPEKDIKAA